MKLHSLLLVTLLASSSASVFADTHKEEGDGYDVLFDAILRPIGLAGTAIGAGVYIGVSPFTAISSIPAPHDAFAELGDLLVCKPFKWTFMRPSGDYDYNEGCMSLPEPVAYQAAPAPVPPPVADCSTMDSDNDGVNNCDDKCPDTLDGVKVSAYGCWVVDVKFDNDKADIKPQYYQELDETAAAIKNHPEVEIEVQGHTSQTGDFQHNMRLSERRADAVKDYIVNGHHLPNVTSKGYGWTQPIDTNETEEGRANNRRVQLEVNGELQSEQ